MYFITSGAGRSVSVAETAGDLNDPRWLSRPGAAEFRSATLASPHGPPLSAVVQWGPPGQRLPMFNGELPIARRRDLEDAYEVRLLPFGKRKRTSRNGDWVLTVLSHSLA